MVPVASLESKSLDGGEANRLINYEETILLQKYMFYASRQNKCFMDCTKHNPKASGNAKAALLLQKYKINIISFIADNAGTRTRPLPSLSSSKTRHTRQLEQVINANTGDPFLPSRLDGTADFDIGGIDKRRCTLHPLQLFITDLCDKLAILKTGLDYADKVYAAIERFMSENKNWRDLFPSLFLPSRAARSAGGRKLSTT
jgi:hypothetical protein